MSQTYGHRCPTCGNPIAADQRFCTNCGTVLEEQAPPPSQYGVQPPSQSYPYSQQTPPYAQQPPSYAQPQVPSYAQAPQQQAPMYSQQQPQQQSPIAEAFGALGLLFLLRGFGGRKYAGYRPRRQRSSCCGCLVLLAVIFLCVGVPALYYASKTSVSSFSQSFNYGSSNSSDSSTVSSQPPITTTQINQTVPYGGADITIVSVQQSKAFMDDPYAGTDGVVRLKMKETNSSTSGTGYVYSDSARLILPDKTKIAPYSEQQNSGPQAGVSRTNWLDFQVPISVQVNQLTLQLGTDTEAQELITLNSKANVAQYQTKTTHPNNATTQYGGVTWTVTTVTTSLDYKGQQAAKGMQFVTVSFKVDNPSSQYFSAYWGDYMRLKSAGITSAPSLSTNFPTSFAAGSTGSTGDVSFSMPIGSTSYTFLFLSTSTYPTASSISFQTA